MFQAWTIELLVLGGNEPFSTLLRLLKVDPNP